jgi:hypothetical protein
VRPFEIVKPFERGDRVRTTEVALRLWADEHMEATVLDCTAIGGIDYLHPDWRIHIKLDRPLTFDNKSRVNCRPEEIERLDAVTALAGLAPAPPEAERGGRG